MNDKLSKSVTLFKTLGWEKVNSDNVLDLPVGTPEQKKTALAGLKSGDWLDWKEGREVWLFDVDVVALAAFAIRVGIDARRAVTVIPPHSNGNDEVKMLETVITSRGEAFANRFILYACLDRYRPLALVDAPTYFGRLVVALVHDIPLTIPRNAGYIKDWVACCAPNQCGWWFEDMRITSKVLLKKIKKRFVEHIHMAIEVGVSIIGPMKDLLSWGIEQKCISKAELCDLAFTALNTPIRPGERKEWLKLLDFLHVSDEELCRHLEELLPVLALGEAAVINRLAPVYIANVSDEMLVPLLMSCFSCTIGKTRQLVLTEALQRKRPPQAEHMADWLTQLCNTADEKSIKLAQKLFTHWNLGTISKPEKADVHGCWLPTPPLWTVPEFSLEETTYEALTQLAAQLMGQAAVAHDITSERFLAIANLLAYKDPEEVRLSLRGLQSIFDKVNILFFICCWVQGKQPQFGMDIPEKRTYGILPARDYMAVSHLGEQPCLLSTPSMEDLSIRADDLLERLKTYQKANAKALEADLYLAMTRLIPENLSVEKKNQWQDIHVAILLQDGETMPINAGQAVLEWLSDPLQDPSIKVHERFSQRCPEFTWRDATGFPPRFSKQHPWYGNELAFIFPLWGEVALKEVVCWNYNEVDHYQGLNLRQAARHNKPFSANVMLNFLAVQRSILAQDAVQDSHLAVIEAWQRGLLQPDLIDVKEYDWGKNTPMLLAAFSVYLDEIASKGLLSLVWSVADPLIQVSSQAPRLFSGTKEMIELIQKYLPEAMAAVKNGVANPEVLNLPGIRMLAARKGNSGAVCTAQKVAEQLPPAI